MVPAGSSILPYGGWGWGVLTPGCHHLLGVLFPPVLCPVFFAMVVTDAVQEAVDKCRWIGSSSQTPLFFQLGLKMMVNCFPVVMWSQTRRSSRALLWSRLFWEAMRCKLLNPCSSSLKIPDHCGSWENNRFSVWILFCFLHPGVISPLTYLRTAFVHWLFQSCHPAALKPGSSWQLEISKCTQQLLHFPPSDCSRSIIPPR